jgi:hypothetical protein
LAARPRRSSALVVRTLGEHSTEKTEAEKNEGVHACILDDAPTITADQPFVQRGCLPSLVLVFALSRVEKWICPPKCICQPFLLDCTLANPISISSNDMLDKHVLDGLVQSSVQDLEVPVLDPFFQTHIDLLTYL